MFLPTKTIAKTLSTAFIAVLVSTPVAAVDYKNLDVLPLNVKAVSVAKGVTIPWAIEPLSNGDLLITERSGALYLLPKNSSNLTKLSGLPLIDANGQGGLLDLALHSGPDDSQWLYITYSSTQGAKSGSNTALMRAKLSDDRTELLSTQLLYKGEHNSTKGQHYGSRIVFDNQGYVYFSIGDRGSRDKNPQDLTRDGGKIYRLHTDGLYIER